MELENGLSWNALLDALLVSHIGGDFIFQTEWQAMNKGLGLGDREGRRALRAHVATYTGAYLPTLAWVARERGLRRALSVGVAVAGPHLLIDDGRGVLWWLQNVKRTPEPDARLRLMVDQAAHVVCLLATSLLASR